MVGLWHCFTNKVLPRAQRHRSPRWNPRVSTPWWPEAQGRDVIFPVKHHRAAQPGPETHDHFHRGIQGQATGVGFFSLGTHGSDEGDKVWDTFESGVLIEIVMLRMVRWRVLRGFGECVWADKKKKKQVEQDTKIFKYFVHVSAKPSRQNFNFNKFTSLPVVNLPLSQDSKLECIDPLPMCPCHRPVHPLLPHSDEVTGLQLGHSKYPCWLVIGGCTCPVCWGWS